MELHVEKLEEIAAVEGVYQLDPDKHYVLQVKDDITLGRISRHRKFDMTKDQAETMMLTMTQREMAKYFGVHPVTLRERLLRLGIKTPGSGCRKPPLT